MSNASDKQPEGWMEPVHEALLRPASFFGAGPRNAVIAVHTVSFMLIMYSGMIHSWLLAGIAVGTACFVQIGTASLSFISPHWFELFVEWLKSPQSKVEP